MSTVLLHGIQNGFGLETSSLQRRTGNVTLLGIRRDAKDCSSCIIVPIRRIQARKGRDEEDAAIVGHRFRQFGNVLAFVHEFHIVHEELDARAGYGNASFECVHAPIWTEIEGHGGEKTVAGDDGLFSYIVQEEASGTVGVLGKTWFKSFLANQSGRLVSQASCDGCTFECCRRQ